MPVLALLIVALAAGSCAAALALRYPHAVAGASVEPVAEGVVRAVSRHAALRRWLRSRRDPGALTGLALTLAALVVLAGGLIVAVLAYLVRENDTLRRIDSAAAEWGHDHASDASDAIVTAVTQLGENWFVITAGVLIAVVEWRRGSSRLVAPFLVLVVVGDKLLTTGIKELADRARPTLNPIAETLGPSFPSGHSSTAAAFFAAAALVLGRGRRRWPRAVIVGAAVGLAVAVAASRVLLDVHWLSDVLAGLALGWAWFALCAVAVGGRLLRFGATAERIESGVEASAAGTPPT